MGVRKRELTRSPGTVGRHGVSMSKGIDLKKNLTVLQSQQIQRNNMYWEDKKQKEDNESLEQ